MKAERLAICITLVILIVIPIDRKGSRSIMHKLLKIKIISKLYNCSIIKMILSQIIIIVMVVVVMMVLIIVIFLIIVMIIYLKTIVIKFKN